MPIPDYSEKNMEKEQMIQDLLEIVRKTPGAILGKLSLEVLYSFVSGFSFSAIMRDNYRPHFDRDFQEFTARMFPDRNKNLHWHHLIGEDVSDIDAFWLFFDLYDRFREEQSQENCVG